LSQAIEMTGNFLACKSPVAGFLPLPEAAATSPAQNFGGGEAAC
jgi:hypothetical protein